MYNMEYSIEEVQKLTSAKILEDNQNAILYDIVWEQIFSNASKGQFNVRVILDSDQYKDIDFYSFAGLFTMQGFHCWIESNDSTKILYIDWRDKNKICIN